MAQETVDTEGGPAEVASADKKPKKIEIKVTAPREPKPRKFTFEQHTLVGVAADEVANAFGYATGSPTFQNDKDVLLNRDETLHQAHVKDGDKLELVDVGGGV